MSNKHKQSKVRKNNHPRNHRRARNLLKNQRPYIPTMPKLKNAQGLKRGFRIERSQYINLEMPKSIDSYVESLQRDIELYARIKQKNKAPGTLLTQIQRKLRKLEDKLGNPNIKESDIMICNTLHEKLLKLGYHKDLEIYEIRCQSKGLIKNPKTNHYIQPTDSFHKKY